MLLPPFADIDFSLRVADNLKSGTPQHGLDAGAIRNPPVGRVAGVAMLDKVRYGIPRLVENFRFAERIFFKLRGVGTAAQQRLENKGVVHNVLVEEIER
jgi:hypothetical protein